MRRPVGQGGTLPRSQAGAGLVGSTVATQVYPKATDRVSAATIFDTYVGLPGALTVQKCFFNEGVLPNFVSANIYRLTVAGCKLIMCFRPSRKLTQSQRNKLKKTCELYRSRGVNFDVVLWQEANDIGGNFFPDGAAYVAYHEYYRPYVPGGIQVIYDAGGDYPGYQQAFYPGDDQVDMVYCDIYCSAWVQGRTLDTIMGIADGASPPKPFGIGEFGLSATGRNLPSHSQYDRFITYLTNTLTGRLSHGKQNGDVMYFDGVDTTTPWNTITGPSDWKTPYYQNLYKALRRG